MSYAVSFRLPVTLWTVLLLGVLSLPCCAQSDAGAGALRGTVRNEDGKGAANISITVRNAETSYVRAVASDAKGRFDAQALAPGRYVVQAAEGSMKTEEVETLITVGRTNKVDLVLKASTVSVGAEGQTQTMAIDPESSIDTRDVSNSSNVYLRAISAAPIRGRSFPDFVQMTPDIHQESNRNGLVISGQRAVYSYVALDGTDFNDPLQGNQRGGNDAVFFFPLSAVREFQAVRSGADAEVGRTNAGFVNVATKSGTNTWHGEAFYANRNSDFTSLDPFGDPSVNVQHEFGGSLGGAIKRDKAFFFVAAEQNLLTIPFIVQFDPQPAGVTLPAALLALQGEKEGTNNTTSAFARLDYSPTYKEALNLELLYANLDAKDFGAASRNNDEAESSNFDRQASSMAFKASLMSVFTTAMLNELRGQIANDLRFEEPNVFAPMVVITGVGTIGGEVSHPRMFDNSRYEVTDNLSITKGRHSLRVGVDFNFTPASSARENFMSGRYDFKSLSDFMAGKVSRYRGTVPTGDPSLLVFQGHQQELGFFIQDKFSLTGNLTVNAGFRWDGQWNPQPLRPNPAIPQTTSIPNDLSMWQPRLGIAWDPRGHGHMVIRLSAGLYDARTPANLFQRVFTDNGLVAAVLDSKFDSKVLNFAKFPNALTSIPAGVTPSPQKVVGVSPDFHNPRSFQTSGSIETALNQQWSLSAGYTRNSTWGLQRRLDHNLFAPTFDATGTPIFPVTRPNPSIGPLSINESEAHSTYEAFDFIVNKRMGRRLQLQAGYTLAWNRDDDSSEHVFEKEPALDPFAPEMEASWSKNDIRNNFRLSGILDLPYGFTVSAITLARSATPFTPVIGFDTQNDGNEANDRAIINGHVAGRDSMRGRPFADLNMRVLKAFHLGERINLNVYGELFNVTHNSNRYFGPDSTSAFGTPAAPVATAGQPLFSPLTTRFGGPRQVQLGAHLTF
jgi:hypothetical protein